MTLSAARDRIRAGDRVGAMESLLGVWRERRTLTVGALIRELDESMPPARVAGVVGSAAYEVRWARRATGCGVGLVGRFSKMIDRVERLELMMMHAPDPRLSHAVAEILRDLRPALSGLPDDNRDLWLRCAEVVEHLGDPSLVSLRDAPAPWNSDWTPGGLTLRLSLALDNLERAFPDVAPIEERERALIEEMRASLSSPSAAQQRTEEERLLTAIYAAPQDDGPRHIYADWLLEHEDARGELMQLQLRGEELTAPAQGRLDELLRRAKKHWVGPLAPVVREPVFRRGMLAEARVSWGHRGNIERLGAHPAWATLEEVAFAQDPWSETLPQHLDSRVTTSLRTVRDLAPRGLGGMLAAEEPWMLRELSTEVAPAHHGALQATTLLPELRELTLFGTHASRALDWLWNARFAQQLTRLEIYAPSRRHVWKVQMAASRLHALEELWIRTSGVVMQLERGPEWRMTNATLGLAASGADLDAIVELVEAAPEYAFTHLIVEATLSAAQLERLDAALSNQRGLDDIVIQPDTP